MSKSADTKMKIHGPISPDQAKTLRDFGSESPAAKAMFKEIGATADEHSVALVLADGPDSWRREKGRIEDHDHYVTLDPRDIGGIILPDREGQIGFGLPTTNQALSELMPATPANLLDGNFGAHN